MSEIKGTNVAAQIVPFTTDDTYPTHEAKYGKGGYRTVQDIQERNAIPEARLEEGMLVYVVNDPDNIHMYQYINSTWTKSKIGSAGVEKVETIEDMEGKISEVGDIIYVKSTGELYTKLDNNFWKPISFGIPIFTKQQEDELSDIGKLPDDFISIPDPNELSLPINEQTTYNSTGKGYYLDIIFSTIRALQAEVAKLKNSFTFGINSYTGKDTAMGRIVGSYKPEEQEPLWDVDEADLSIVTGAEVDLTNNNSLVPSSNVTVGEGYLAVEGIASWINPKEGGFIEVEDPKLYIFMTTSSLNVILHLASIESGDIKADIDLSTLGLKRYEGDRYNIMFCLSRITSRNNEGVEETAGYNYLWISVGNYLTGGVEDQGYWNPETNKLQSKLVTLNRRYTIESVSFEDLNLYKFNGYSKYQDLFSTVDPVIPTDENYKYRVAHITIRSVKNEDDLQSIKSQLLANELIYNEQTGVLWIKTSSGNVRPISGSGDHDSDGMEKSEIIEWLAQNGIIVTEDGSNSVKLNDIADITFVHQETGKKFKFSVDNEGNLVSEEIPELTMADRARGFDEKYPLVDGGNNVTYTRGFVGLLGAMENNKNPNEKADHKLYSDRVKIGAVYAPYSPTQPTYGCSHAFIELENTSDKDFPLDGCFLHYVTGTSGAEGQADDLNVYTLALSGYIPAGGTYLIRGKKYADFEQANTFIKVETFDIEWYITNEGNKKELIDLTQNKNNTYLLTYGLENLSESATVVIKNGGGDPSYKTSDFPYFFHPYYIDSISIGAPVTVNSVPAWVASNMKFFSSTLGITGGEKRDVIYKNTFELDPAKQAYQSCNVADSSRARNANEADYQYLILEKDIIEFPKTAEIFSVSKYTPKASWEHKNVCTDKSKLDKNKPNMVTVSFGIDMYKTRCFNWISCGSFDEYIWIRRKGTSDWVARFESYKDGIENDDYSLAGSDSGMRKKTFGTFVCKTGGEHTEPIKKYIYNRIHGTFPADGTNYTSHKCIINIVSDNVDDKTVYEYVVGRADKNMNPDANHISNPQEFTLYPDTYTPRIFQITDQQGFHWIEYQCWAAAAEEVNKTIAEISASENIIPILVNTGDMTQNGTRVNEWLDYYNAGYCLFNHLEQANVVGNNDLCDTNPEILGTGDDNGKSNSFYFHVFYCYEINENILPIITNLNATKYIPSLYYIETTNTRFVFINTEITQVNCEKWYKQIYNSQVVNVYTGWTIPNDTTIQPVYDNTFTTVYTMIYDILNLDNKEVITACHEMPFTVVTGANLAVTSSNAANANVDRSLNGSSTGALVGCHGNRLNSLDSKGIYWFSRLLEHFRVKLCIGGHKHTYACTNPLREFYYYGENGSQCSIDGPMTMNRTLENDSAVWNTTIKGIAGTNGTIYNINNTTGVELPFNTTKFPLMKTPTGADAGITRSSSVIYPYYGVSSLTGGVTYFMCQATGFKLKSNKELPSPDQRFAYVIPKTDNSGSSDKPSKEQQLPMFAEIKLNGSGSYSIYLYRIENILASKGSLFSQVNYSTNPASYDYLVGNEASSASELPIYGKWHANEKVPLIELN